MLGVILVVIIVQKGSKKRKSNLTGKKTKEKNAKNYDNRKQIEDFIHKNRSNARAYYIRRLKAKQELHTKLVKNISLHILGNSTLVTYYKNVKIGTT